MQRLTARKNNMEYGLFNKAHLITLGIFALAAVVFFFLVGKFKQTEAWKERIFQFLAIGNFIVHISIVWYLFITNDSIFVIPFNLLWPLATCNIVVFFNLVICVMNKQSKVFKFVAAFCAWLGIIGGILSLLAGKTGPVDFDNVRSLTSHFIMILASTYIFIAGYAKISVNNLLPVAVGLIFNGILGLLTNHIFYLKGWADQNAMWLHDGLIPGVAATKGPYVALYAMALIFIFTAIYEQIKVEKGSRWYDRLGGFFKTKKTR